MNSEKQYAIHNTELVQKYGITNTYLAKCINKKFAIHSLNIRYFDDTAVYALYTRNGDYMILIDAFLSYEEANQQAKSIINSHQELAKIFNI
ncbi:hypothetical protein ABLB84_20000 [Xenorhabdus szentirmaii]|uniref:hypothetical protein n=1 Tax=Xenorhabdus szentirmaii TaxID=290112 RepID=UPI0032B7E44B